MPDSILELGEGGVLENLESDEETYGPQDWSGICEYKTSPACGMGPGGTSITRIFDVPWDRYYQWCREMIGYPYMDGDTMKRKLPDMDAEWPNLFCTRLSKPNDPGFFAGQNLEATTYPLATAIYARVAATYESLKYPVLPLAAISTEPAELSRYCIKRVRGAGEYLASQWGALIFDDGTDTQVSSRIGIWQPASMITYELFDFLPQAWDAERAQKDLCGRTNSESFDGYEAGTLLLMSAEYDWEVSPLGERVQRITLAMYYKPTGINKAPKPATGVQTLMKYKELGPGGETIRPLREADFGLILSTTPTP